MWGIIGKGISDQCICPVCPCRPWFKTQVYRRRNAGAPKTEVDGKPGRPLQESVSDFLRFAGQKPTVPGELTLVFCYSCLQLTACLLPPASS